MDELVKCPVCGEPDCSKTSLATKSNPHPLGQRYDCRRCGSFILPDKYGQLQQLSPRQRALLSHTLRRKQRDNGPPPEVSDSILPEVDEPLPNPAELAERLILWIGEHQSSPEEFAKIPLPEVSAWIGTAIMHETNPPKALTWLLAQYGVKSCIEGDVRMIENLRLTMKGWQRYEALKRAEIESHWAFMAMKFDVEMDHVVKSCFKPAVAKTGFELKSL
jgi:hypothetical protein